MLKRGMASLLERVAQGEVSVGDALEQLCQLPYEPVEGIALLDHHRELRQGFPEFVYAEGKQPRHVAKLMARLVKTHGAALATRACSDAAEVVQTRLPEAHYDSHSKILRVGGPLANASRRLNVGVLSAGTSDLSVAEEAAQVEEFLGHGVTRLYDVGVSGLQRLLDQTPTLRDQDALIVVAGMDGALPSVVGGLVGMPVIAVPTSVGYGAHFDGLAPLLAMLNACAAGVTVVNIDNGFGAALAAHRIGTCLDNRGQA